jgi:hypothetical protein
MFLCAAPGHMCVCVCLCVCVYVCLCENSHVILCAAPASLWVYVCVDMYMSIYMYVSACPHMYSRVQPLQSGGDGGRRRRGYRYTLT